MSENEDRFEQYLRSFAGPKLPGNLLDRSAAKARAAHRLKRVVAGVLAAAAALLIAFTLWSRGEPPQGSGSPTPVAKTLPGSDADLTEYASLQRAFRDGGISRLESQLDRTALAMKAGGGLGAQPLNMNSIYGGELPFETE